MGEAFGRFEELIVKSNGGAHAAKHIDEASICQAASLRQQQRISPIA